ncbi:alpha/beta hydrolase [Tistrella mobilis]|uniref:alpha/beta hydrolase n=1 Tax=Tistrella mobilis TaxID=171437 RepID=UPI003557EF38
MATLIHFATNRKPAPKTVFSEGFNDDPDELRFGTASFEGSALYRAPLDAVAASAEVMIRPENLARNHLGSTDAFAAIRQAVAGHRDVLLFVHGYNHSFQESLGRAVQIQQWLADGGRDVVMVLFAWPSLGRGVNGRTYRDERSRAQMSGPALGRLLLKATDFLRTGPSQGVCTARIHLLAHSMGNWVLRGGICHMRTFVGDNIPPLFDEVILTAGDEDDDTLSNPKKLAPLLRGCRRVTVYYNQQDLALKASDVAMGNPDRLGLSGPLRPEALPAKIAAINVSPVILRNLTGDRAWEDDPTGHQYFRNNAVVRADMLHVLTGALDEEIPNRSRRAGWWRLG